MSFFLIKNQKANLKFAGSSLRFLLKPAKTLNQDLD